jgi:micrococcal nuclease
MSISNPLYLFNATVTKVKDGDTFVAVLDQGFGNAKKATFRLRGIDTPETWRPKTDAEDAHGQLATAFVTNLFTEVGMKVYVHSLLAETSIYGRYDAHVYLSLEDFAAGKHLTSMLIEAGFSKKTKEEYLKEEQVGSSNI